MRIRRAGFTLVEILVVLSILGLLSAILMPVIWKAHAAGRTASCAQNLKQMALALSLYTRDHNERYPPAVGDAIVDGAALRTRSWREIIAPYTSRSSELACPDVESDALAQSAPEGLSGYAYNLFFNRALGTAKSYTLTGHADVRVRFPTRTITFCDARGHHRAGRARHR